MTFDITNKVPVHIGLFGHIDSGKTAIAKVLSEVISTAGIDAHPQSKERGITIDLGFTSFILEKFIITLVDGPGHADLIKISASSVEIIDIAIMVIDINKGPQVQTGEHLIMIESLQIKNIIVLLNKIDLFMGDLPSVIQKLREFFKSTSYGSEVSIFPVSAKERKGFDELKKGLLDVLNSADLKRDNSGNFLMPIDHHFLIKGMGAILTGTILKGKVEINQNIEIVPVGEGGRVKSIQIFHQDVEKAYAGDRIGLNVKGIDIKKVFRGCYATDNKNLFEFSNKLEIEVDKYKLFKPMTNFGTQVHVTVGMFSTVGYIYPYDEQEGKKLRKSVPQEISSFKAFLYLSEEIIIRKTQKLLLLSRLDLPPTSLRILGSAKLVRILKEDPILYKYKLRKAIIENPDHPQGIICTGFAQSLAGAKKITGKKLEPPYTKIISPFGTKGAVIIGTTDINKLNLKKGDQVIFKELRSFQLKSKKDLNVQN
jgi:selenocysteine-specific elongation factor